MSDPVFWLCGFGAGAIVCWVLFGQKSETSAVAFRAAVYGVHKCDSTKPPALDDSLLKLIAADRECTRQVAAGELVKPSLMVPDKEYAMKVRNDERKQVWKAAYLSDTVGTRTDNADRCLAAFDAQFNAWEPKP